MTKESANAEKKRGERGVISALGNQPTLEHSTRHLFSSYRNPTLMASLVFTYISLYFIQNSLSLETFFPSLA